MIPCPECVREQAEPVRVGNVTEFQIHLVAAHQGGGLFGLLHSLCEPRRQKRARIAAQRAALPDDDCSSNKRPKIADPFSGSSHNACHPRVRRRETPLPATNADLRVISPARRGKVSASQPSYTTPAMALTTVPRKVSASRFLSLGATGWVYQINDHIALKYAFKPGFIAFENDMFDLFKKHTPYPYVVQSFLRLPNANFLALMSGGSLDSRLRSYQIREAPFGKVLKVSKIEPIVLVK
ncbi:hypothetical protein F5Y06DRAFT_305452 [Hypoxylon sp. FL0890]|nr:hypothetical protein F5Y06DRAFT_305452 [Hypoxylon sp. FL0890]